MPDDYETIELCKLFSLEYSFTKRVFNNGAIFAKGRAINDGLALLEKTGWLLHLDCDILLPDNIRNLIKSIPLNSKNKSSLFGVRARRGLGAHPEQVGTKEFEIYRKFHNFILQNKSYLKKIDKNSNHDFLILQKKFGLTDIAGSVEHQWKNFTKGKWSNIIYPFEGGQVYHLGYFQLFHSENFKSYPEASPDANNDDITFREKFPTNLRQFLDCDCIHLGFICEGRHFFRILNSYVYRIKHFGKFAYLNKLHRLKIKKASKLNYNHNFYDVFEGGNFRLFLPAIVSSSANKKKFKFGWQLSNCEVPYCKKLIKKINNYYIDSYEFNPKKNNKDWFEFFIPSQGIFDRSNYSQICFYLKTIDLDCELEVGFGNRKKMEWLLIERTKIKNKTWCKIQLTFSKFNLFTQLDTLFAFRNHNIYSKGKISISGIYFQ